MPPKKQKISQSKKGPKAKRTAPGDSPEEAGDIPRPEDYIWNHELMWRNLVQLIRLKNDYSDKIDIEGNTRKFLFE